MSSLVYGSHTEQAYSSDGRTKDLYACCFDFGRTDVNVSSEESKCLVCFCCDIVYMAIPFKVQLYCDTQILIGFISMFKLVGVHVGCMYILLEFYFV